MLARRKFATPQRIFIAKILGNVVYSRQGFQFEEDKPQYLLPFGGGARKYAKNGNRYVPFRIAYGRLG